MTNLLREQVLSFDKHNRIIILGSVLASIVLLFMLWPVINQKIAIIWLSVQVLFNLFRYFYLARETPDLFTDEAVKRRYFSHFIIIIISSLIWAASIFLLLPKNDITYQLLFIMLLVGLASTALNLLSTLPKFFPTYQIIIFSSLIIKLLLVDQSFSLHFIFIILIYVTFSIIASRSFTRSQNELINLRLVLQQQSLQDPLTHLYNRRYFMNQAEIEWKRASRHNHRLSFIIIDLDFFKKVNDTYGHVTGDNVLIKVADILNSNMRRAGEFVSRIGGEEFVVVIPSSDSKGSHNFSEKLRKQISAIEFKDENNKPFQVTASLGLACLIPEKNRDYNYLLDLADKALYDAKNAGRNCTRIYAEP